MADTKDWTWVLDRSCPECGFDASTLARERIGTATRTAVGRLAADLVGDGLASDGLVGQRPQPETWSTLEYGCHTVDVAVDEWARRGFRSNGSAFTVEPLGRYLIHDLVHHVWDIDQAGAARPSGPH